MRSSRGGQGLQMRHGDEGPAAAGDPAVGDPVAGRPDDGEPGPGHAGAGGPGIGLALQLERELDALSADVARSLREDIGPQLAALRTLAAGFESRLIRQSPALAPLAAVLLSQTDALIESVRALAVRTRPDALSCGGLPEALRALAADWRLRRPGCRVEVLIDPADDTLFGLASPAIETVALLAAAAAFDRAFGAAGATNVVLGAARSPDRLLLQIDYDGRAPDPAAAWFSHAQARIRAIGGESQVERGDPDGTVIVVRLPWETAAATPPGAAAPPV